MSSPEIEALDQCVRQTGIAPAPTTVRSGGRASASRANILKGQRLWSPTLMSLLRALCLVAMLGACAEEEGNHVPADLAAIESTAEDAFDSALAGDLDTVRGQAGDLSASWQRFRDRAERDGVAAADLEAMDAAIDTLSSSADGSPNSVELARVANAVSEPMPRLYEVYDPATPAAVLELDYLGREVQLDALDGDFERAGVDVDRVAGAWAPLRKTVLDAGGKAAADDFQDSIDAERTAITAASAADLETAAKAQLDRVDDLERVFERASDPPD